jgi:hypothetical protein
VYHAPFFLLNAPFGDDTSKVRNIHASPATGYTAGQSLNSFSKGSANASSEKWGIPAVYQFPQTELAPVCDFYGFG